MTELVKFGGGSLPANPQDLVKGLQQVNQNLQGSSGGMPFLRLLKSGVFAYGPENIEPEEGSNWAVNPYSLHHGFACWGDGELLDERMVPFNQSPPLRGDLPDYGHEWNQQVSMLLQCLDGEDTGTTVLYKGTSTGLRNAVKKLIDEIIAQAQVDQGHIVPVIALECDSYNHKKYGEIFFPVMDVTQWISIDDGRTAEPETDTDAAEAKEAGPSAEVETPPEAETAKPVRRRRKAKETAAAKEPEPETTKPRRRRRAKA